jgi:hypothetical protein
VLADEEPTFALPPGVERVTADRAGQDRCSAPPLTGLHEVCGGLVVAPLGDELAASPPQPRHLLDVGVDVGGEPVGVTS